MGLRKILTDKDPALHKVCRPVEKFDWRLHKLLDDMRETLVDSGGVGLAAPQVGVNLRVVIVDGSDLTDTYDYLKDFRRVMINPVILEESEETCDFSEGCLSVPGIYAEVTRPSKIKVEYYDENF